MSYDTDFYIKLMKEQDEATRRYQEKMKATYDPKAVEAYKDLLRRVDDGDSGVNENTMQEFLEHHTYFIPTPFMQNHQLHQNCFISKLRIGSYVSDFAYLTKSSDVWNLVLIELESPHRKLLKGDIHKPEFSADYQHAFQQIKDWKTEIEKNKEGFLRCLDCIRTPLEHNEVFFKYVIVMGRNAEKSEAGRKLIARECEAFVDGLSIITYDRLLSDYERKRRSLSESIVLTIDESGIANIKLLPEGEISTTMFSWVNRDHLKISKEHIEKLKKQDYEMDSWLEGKLLDYNEKYTTKGLAEKLSDGSPMKALLKSD